MNSQRLDQHLAEHFPEHTRSFWSRAIATGYVKVNKKNSKASYLVQPEDKISISLPAADENISLEPNTIPLKVIYKDEDVLVINKPAGLIVHPGNGTKNDTLVNALINYDPTLINVGTQKDRPGIVHRLDKGTSGLMIIARHQKAYDFLRKAFDQRQVKKTYLALTYGDLNEEEGEINLPLTRSKKNPTTFTIAQRGGRTALTKFKVLKQCQPYLLLEVQPYTGRTHQIRVHLKAKNIPIVGDADYGLEKVNKKFLNIIARPALHAWKLELDLPSGIHKKFTAPLPPDLISLLNQTQCAINS